MKLLPCPFCGGPAVNVAGEYITCGRPPLGGEYRCVGRQIKADVDDDCMESKAWNTRAAPPDRYAEAMAAIDACTGPSVPSAQCSCGGSPGQQADHHDISCPLAISSTQSGSAAE